MYGGAAAAVFTPLDPLSRAERVTRRLTDGIVLGLLPPDQALPGEAELAALLGVSTVTVREALRSLREQGLIVTRRGRGGGSFVRSDPVLLRDLVRARLRSLSTAQIRDIGDHYAAVAGAAARLAALRATPDDLQRLDRACVALARAASEVERRRAESHVHIEVAALAQSPMLFREEIEMQADVGSLLWLAAGQEDAHARNLAHARDLLAAIRAGDGDRARHLAEQRVGTWTRRLVEGRLRLVEEDA